MSFLSDLFNKKEQSEHLKDTNETVDIPVTEEEYLDEEDFYGTSEEDSLMEGEEATLVDNKDTDLEYEVVEREILPAKIICPDCGGITLEGLDFCDKCGGELL